MAKVKTAPKELSETLSEFPNFSANGSVIGMKKLYYGNYIYNVTSQPEIYNNLP